MNLKNKMIAIIMTVILTLSLSSQNLLAEEEPIKQSSLHYEVTQQVNEDKTEALITLAFFANEESTIKKVIFPDGAENTADFETISYSVTGNGIYEFKVNYDSNGQNKTETISIDVSELEGKNNENSPTNNTPVIPDSTGNESVLNGNIDELNVSFQLKAATKFSDGSPVFGVKEIFRKTNEEILYDGWQLMQLDLKISYQNGLEISSVQPNKSSLYPQHSIIEKDDTEGEWRYSFYFKQNGNYEFQIDYTLNGVGKSVTVSQNVVDLVYIEDLIMRRLLVQTWGDFSGLYYDEQYVTKEWLGQVEGNTPTGESYFTFGLNVGRADEYVTSLDGLQYLTSIDGMYIFNCKKITGTIEPITQGYYPALRSFRVSELNQRPQMPKNAYNGLLVAQCIEKMPALTELVINATGFSDMTVLDKIAQQRLDMGLQPQLTTIQAMLNSISSLDGIESQPNLSSINLGQNQIQSIEQLRNIKNINFLNLTANQVFDLTPVYENLTEKAIPGNGTFGFGGRDQTINYPQTVKAVLEENRYRIELPMPIDIDGSPTETASVKGHYQDVEKTYTASKENGKIYILISTDDLDMTLENPFEDVVFEFDFNNNNGTDSRTKGYFTGKVRFKASPLNGATLQIDKTVQGTGADTNQEFTFNVMLKSQSGQATIATEYSYSGVSHEQGVPSPTDGKISFDATGKSSDIKLKHGQGIRIENLPTSTEYEVMEVEANLNGYVTTASGQNGILVEGETKTAQFINEYRGGTSQPKSGDLSVHLIVTGNGADTTKTFPFTVRLDDSSITGTFGQMEFKSGVATFTLRHNQTVSAKGLPYGIGYTVTESGYEGYNVSMINDIGTIPEGKEVKASFTNHKSDSPVITPDCQSPATPPASMVSSKPDSGIPNTADNSDVLLWLSLGSLSLIGFILAIIAHLQKKN